MVDVPGLIEGAHEGAGLGDQFLKHVERTRALVHLLDGAKPLDEMLHDKATIEGELRAWNPALVEKPTILAVSKLDLPDAQERLRELRERFPATRGISSATREGVQELVYAVWQTIKETPPPQIVTPPPALIELIPEEAFGVERDADGAFVITGPRIERLAAVTNFDSDEALARFERTLAKMGVEKKLRELGAAEGDTVRIGQYEFTYS
jgi:GTP-binding protein